MGASIPLRVGASQLDVNARELRDGATRARLQRQPFAGISPRLRLVVLPFSTLSDEIHRERFSGGLTEELIVQLGALRSEVDIVAPWSSRNDHGSLPRARDIGQSLHAGYLLEGSTRHEGARVRIIVGLVEAATELIVWSDTYERIVHDTLAVQTDVAERIAHAIVKKLMSHLREGQPSLVRRGVAQ